MKFDLVRDDAVVLPYMAEHAPMGNAEFKDGDSGWAIMRGDGVVTALVAFSGWQPQFSSIEFSGIALKSYALSTEIVLRLGDYVFRQLKCNRVWARTSSKNARARKLLRHIGFTPEGTSADFYGVGLHAENFRLLRKDWDAIHGRISESAVLRAA